MRTHYTHALTLAETVDLPKRSAFFSMTLARLSQTKTSSPASASVSVSVSVSNPVRTERDVFRDLEHCTDALHYYKKARNGITQLVIAFTAQTASSHW